MHIKIWSIPVRLMHWTLVAAFAVAFYTRDMELSRNVHVYAGYAAGAVLALRVLYGCLARDFASFRHMHINLPAALRYLRGLLLGGAHRSLGHNPAGTLMVYALIATGILTVVTGYLSFNDMGLLLLDESGVEVLHAMLPWIWLTQVALHILGVTVGSLAHRENLPLAMITGIKARHTASIREPLPEALAISLLKGAILALDLLARIFGGKRVVITKRDILSQ